MTITAEAPRGGIVEYIGGASRTFVLRNREIERFEDKHRGIFDLFDGLFGKGQRPNSREIRDILALGLVGGGMKDHEADAVIANCNPEDLQRMFAIAQAVVGVAFMPDAIDEAEAQSKKKTSQEESHLVD